MKTFLVGSKNPVKIQALRDLVPEFAVLQDAAINGVALPERLTLDVPPQPKSLDDTVSGAAQRAMLAAITFDPEGIPTNNRLFGIGVESGLMPALRGRDVWFDVTVASIFQGTGSEWLGLSWGFVVPPDVMEHIHAGLELSDAAKAAGYTSKEKIGNEEGIIGVLTGGRVPRVEQVKSALRMALHNLERELLK